jgi:hypothetical protein
MIQPITPPTHSTECAPGKRAQRAWHWQDVLTRYDTSGLTQRAFCQLEGIAYASFVTWLGKRRRTLTRIGRSHKAATSGNLQLPTDYPMIGTALW